MTSWHRQRWQNSECVCFEGIHYELGKDASITCGNKVVDQCVVVLSSEQGAGEHHTVEWDVVFSHKVV